VKGRTEFSTIEVEQKGKGEEGKLSERESWRSGSRMLDELGEGEDVGHRMV